MPETLNNQAPRPDEYLPSAHQVPVSQALPGERDWGADAAAFGAIASDPNVHPIIQQHAEVWQQRANTEAGVFSAQEEAPASAAFLDTVHRRGAHNPQSAEALHQRFAANTPRHQAAHQASTEFISGIAEISPDERNTAGAFIELAQEAIALGDSAETYQKAVGSEPAQWARGYQGSQDVDGEVIGRRGGVAEIGYQKDYKVSRIPIALPVANRGTSVESDTERYVDFATADDETRRTLLDVGDRKFQDLYAQENPEHTKVDFEDLKPWVKQAMLADRLFEAQAKSEDPTAIEHATEKNRADLESGPLRTGDYAHSTHLQYLDKILRNGLVCGEAIGDDAKADTYPFNVDFTEIGEADTQGSTYAEQLEHQGLYGNVLLVFRRDDESTDYGDEVGGVHRQLENHKLVFGAVPSTELRAVCVRPPADDEFIRDMAQHDAEQDCLEAIDSIVTHGQYIPVYDGRGNLALTYDEFTRRRQTGEYGSFVREDYYQSESGPDISSTYSSITVEA